MGCLATSQHSTAVWHQGWADRQENSPHITPCLAATAQTLLEYGRATCRSREDEASMWNTFYRGKNVTGQGIIDSTYVTEEVILPFRPEIEALLVGIFN